jgi:hypothetical protein
MMLGLIKGYVQDKITAQRIANAHITTNTGISVYSSDGQWAPLGYYEFPHEAGTFGMHCEASGYQPWNRSGVILAEGQTKMITIKMTP